MQIYSDNATPAQRWALKRESDGYYTIKSVTTGKAIELASGNPAARTNVQTYTDNGTDAQRWAIQKNDNGTYSFINKKNGLALDIAGAKAAKGTNAQAYIATGGKSQQLTLKATDVLPEGVYSLYTMLAPTKQVLDSSAKRASGQATTLQNKNTATAQKFVLKKTAQNTYTITAVATGMQLAASGSSLVQQKASNAHAAQWVASFEGNGVVFRNAATGKALSVDTAKVGTKAKAADTKGSSMRFRAAMVNLIDNGTYVIQNASGNALDIAGASYSNNANVQQHKVNGNGAQAFKITSLGNGYYKIVNAKSLKALEASGGNTKNGTNVQQYAYNGSAAQQWKAELDANGCLVFVNRKSGKVLDVAGGPSRNTKSDANIQIYTKNSTAAQEWALIPTTYSLSGNAKLDEKVARILGNLKGSNKLLAANNYVASFPYRTSSHASGSNWSVPFALDMINQHSGNCYRYAALFQWLARGLGYNAKAVSGAVPARAGGWAPHGWVEIYTSSGTRICDPDMQHALAGYNWYWQTYASAPVEYRKY